MRELIVLLCLSTAVASGAQPVAVWRDQDLGAAASKVSEWLRAAGCQVTFLTTDQLVAAGVLDPRHYRMLVMPYGGHYPCSLPLALGAYLKTGGTLWQCGGPPFTTPLYLKDGKWRTAAELAAWGHSFLVADFNATPLWKIVSAEDDRAVQVSRAGEGDDRCLRLATPHPCHWQYAGCPLSHVPANDYLLAFRARGGPAVRCLCLELHGAGDSRWKKVVPLTSQWRTYVVHLAEFASYATKGRGAAKDVVRPGELNLLLAGYTDTMLSDNAGGAGCWIEIDDVRFLPLTMGGIPALPPDIDLQPFFGKEVKSSPAEAAWQMPFRLRQRGSVRAVVAVAGSKGRLSSGRVAVYPPTRQHRAPLTLFFGSARPWSKARAAFSGAPGPASDQAGQSLAGDVVERLLRDPALLQVATEFLADPQPLLRVSAVVCAPSGEGAHGQLDLRLETANQPAVSRQIRISVAASSTREQTAEFPAANLDWREYAVRARLSGDNHEADEMRDQVDARGTLRRLCDWLCNHQQEGKFSGISFQDQRAARGLLAASDIFHQPRYRQAAMAWGEEMVREQRPDGGYRMGYGILPDGQEECYVADGGETATGMIALYSYATGQEKRRLRRSIDAYMKFRQSFRTPDGDLGIGWCLTDYLARPPTRRAKVFREDRPLPFTTGCTLATAAAYAALTGHAEDRQWAERDAQRVMQESHSLLGGAFVEGLCWAHHYLPDPQLRGEIAACMREKWLPYVTNPKRRWWLEGGGRDVQGLDSLTYYYQTIRRDPRVLATIMRATAAVCGTAPPASVTALLSRENLSSDEKRYLCFSAVTLADVLQPNSTLVALPER